MAYYLLGIRNDIHIIDLEQTIVMMRRALNFIKKLYENRGSLHILPNSRSMMTRIAISEIFFKIEHKHDIDEHTESAEGIPQAIFCINPSETLIKETLKLQITTIAILGSNSNPFGITYPIPGSVEEDCDDNEYDETENHGPDKANGPYGAPSRNSSSSV
jgi:ribosomal protein S2